MTELPKTTRADAHSIHANLNKKANGNLLERAAPQVKGCLGWEKGGGMELQGGDNEKKKETRPRPAQETMGQQFHLKASGEKKLTAGAKKNAPNGKTLLQVEEKKKSGSQPFKEKKKGAYKPELTPK